MRTHILETAAALFYKEGVRAVGVDRIVAEADIGKATLYRHFTNKEDLVIAYLMSRHERFLEEMSGVLDQAGALPLDRVAAVFDLVEQKAGSKVFRGCAFMLAVAEQEESSAIRSVAKMHKDAVLQLFNGAFKDCVAEPLGFAQELLLLYDGAMVTALLRRNKQSAGIARRIAYQLLAQHLRQPS